MPQAAQDGTLFCVSYTEVTTLKPGARLGNAIVTNVYCGINTPSG
jgi:hypothetical protein